MISNDPTLVAFAQHVERVWAQVPPAGQLHPDHAMSACIADALAASVADGVDPEVADELLNMATTWATTRAQTMTAQLLLAETPIPDDASSLDPGEPS